MAACRTGSLILTAKPIAGRGAEYERREPGQDDPDATGSSIWALGQGWTPVLVIRWSEPGRRPYPGNATAELNAAAQTAKDAGGYCCPYVPHPGITLSNEGAEGERAHSRRSVLE
jgi:hypothetical protein